MSALLAVALLALGAYLFTSSIGAGTMAAFAGVVGGLVSAVVGVGITIRLFYGAAE